MREILQDFQKFPKCRMFIVRFRVLYIKHTFDFVHVCLVVTIEFLKEKHITKWAKTSKGCNLFYSCLGGVFLCMFIVLYRVGMVWSIMVLSEPILLGLAIGEL